LATAIIVPRKRIRSRSDSNALFDINLIVKLLHLLMHIGLFIRLYLLNFMFNYIDPRYYTFNLLYLLPNFLNMLTNCFPLMIHMIQKLIFLRIGVITYDLYHHFFEGIYFRVFFFVVFHYVFFVRVI